MHAYRPGQGAARSRVLYLFRSPPLTQIGRKPLDPEVREALEHTHPDLTFDWIGLLREPMPPPRPDPRERSGRQRPSGRSQERGGGGRERPSGPPAAAIAAVIEDDSPLGRAIGGAEAARLRARFAELNQRISRRSRSPEERDRLLETARTLNPDDWKDEASIRANRAGIEAKWDAITAELPRRRRGRRGGKNAGPDPRLEAGPDQDRPAGVIIEDRDVHDEDTSDAHDPPPPMADVDLAGAPGDSDPGRPADAAEAARGSGEPPETDVR